MPVAELQLQHVETGPGGALRGGGEVGSHGGQLDLVGLVRGQAAGAPGQGRGGEQRPALGERAADAVRSGRGGGAPAAGVGELDADRGVAHRSHRVQEFGPGGLLAVGPQPGAAVGGPALGADGRHPGDHQPGAAERVGGQLGPVEGTGQCVGRGEGGERRDDDPVAQLQGAQLQRAEHRGHPGRAADGGLDGGRELRVAGAQTAVGDPAAAGEEVEGELVDAQAGTAADRLEPLQAGLGGPLGGLHHRPPLGLVGRQGGVQGGLFTQTGGQGEGVLQGQLGARTDREVRGVRGVAQQDEVAVAPTGVAHRGEADPPGGVGDQPVAVQVPGEQLRAAPHARGVALAACQLACGEGLEARAAPGVLGDLDDEGRAGGAVRVGVHLEGAEVELLDDEGEGLEDPVGGEPDVAAVPLVQLGAEGVRVSRPGAGMDAVGGHHQVVLGGEPVDRRGGCAVAHVHRQFGAAPLQDGAQPVAVEGGETVPAAGADLAGVADVDVAPAGELGADRGEDLRVGPGDAVQGLVGEHHAESELVLPGVAFVDGDLPLGGQLLGQGGEVEPARTGADHRDPMRSGECAAWRRHATTSGCWGPASASARRTGAGQGSAPLACGAACTTDIRPLAARPVGPCTSKA